MLREGMANVMALGNALLKFTHATNELQALNERAEAVIQSARIAVETLTKASKVMAKAMEV
jgi:hypothetical protein